MSGDHGLHTIKLIELLFRHIPKITAYQPTFLSGNNYMPVSCLSSAVKIRVLTGTTLFSSPHVPLLTSSHDRPKNYTSGEKTVKLVTC